MTEFWMEGHELPPLGSSALYPDIPEFCPLGLPLGITSSFFRFYQASRHSSIVFVVVVVCLFFLHWFGLCYLESKDLLHHVWGDLGANVYGWVRHKPAGCSQMGMKFCPGSITCRLCGLEQVT